MPERTFSVSQLNFILRWVFFLGVLFLFLLLPVFLLPWCHHGNCLCFLLLYALLSVVDNNWLVACHVNYILLESTNLMIIYTIDLKSIMSMCAWEMAMWRSVIHISGSWCFNKHCVLSQVCWASLGGCSPCPAPPAQEPASEHSEMQNAPSNKANAFWAVAVGCSCHPAPSQGRGAFGTSCLGGPGALVASVWAQSLHTGTAGGTGGMWWGGGTSQCWGPAAEAGECARPVKGVKKGFTPI